MRCLRSKRLRAALYRAAVGRCRWCGEELGQDWEADHVVPFRVTHETIPSEMQAICRRCNRRKGDKMAGWRKHQRDMERIVNTIVSGDRPASNKVIVCDVVPGGGKTIMFMLAGCRLLDAGVVEQVITIVPRTTLQKQTAKEWAKASPANPRGFCLAESRNELPLYQRDATPLFRGSESPVVGLVATTGQLMSMCDEYIALARKRPTVLFLDEVHFLGGDDPASAARWARDAMRLAEVCTWVVVASGTLWRHDGQPIPLVEYEEPNADGVRLPKRDITYSLRDALAERPPAIKPIHYERHDADVEFLRDEDTVRVTLSTADEKNENAALTTFLRRQEIWQPIVDRCLEHLRGWREHVYPIASDHRGCRPKARYPARLLHPAPTPAGHDARDLR